MTVGVARFDDQLSRNSAILYRLKLGNVAAINRFRKTAEMLSYVTPLVYSDDTWGREKWVYRRDVEITLSANFNVELFRSWFTEMWEFIVVNRLYGEIIIVESI